MTGGRPSDSSGSSVNEPASLNGMSRTESSNSAFLANLNKKQPRFSNSNEAVISVDRISDMPYSILCFILSFLSTKEAVATSILSKRWQLVWTGISNLDFGNCWTTKHRTCNYLRNHKKQDNEGSVSFEQSINQVFHLFGAESIEKFHLEWPHDKYPFSVDAWITTALSRNLRVLSIYFCCHHLRIRLPDALFTCKTLEVLALGGGISINVPCSVSFPRLISLNLESVYYETDESVCKIISACPVLNSLHIVRHPDDNLVKLNISCSSLRRLEVRTRAEHHSGTNFNFVVTQHKLEIDAPALECLYLHDRISENFTIKSPASLVEADIDVYRRSIYSADSVFRHSVVELVQALCYAKCLTLSRGTMKALGLATTRLSVKFPRLTKLEIETDMCDWSTLKDLLQSSENLEVLHHCKKDPSNIVGVVPYDFCWKEPIEVPRCLSSSLREISISKLGGFQDELVLIRYILEHGRVMRRMELNADYFVPEERFKVLQLITFCTRKFSRFEIVHGRGMPD